ncbi:NAD-binding protein [Ileibacterium valens]|nr:NAD-binding protein [Ileibacterium valens]
MDLYWPRLLKNDKEPGFYVKHFIKDMNLALNQAEKLDLDLPVLEKTRDEYVSLHEDDLGTQALVDYYDPKKK